VEGDVILGTGDAKVEDSVVEIETAGIILLLIEIAGADVVREKR